ncbi:MOSC domain-containing protein [Microbacterium terrisoli]|uniref:MOSC domain-containing protein n=1 Tax=Microbacterium terrisoli TaxID=3242192 RepID=UPI0028058CB1|nr:MOSC domain-containing protein [Microbacterium protaetiae]
MTDDAPVTGTVTAVHVNAEHGFSKRSVAQISLVEGLGVEGDAHFGATVQHRSRVRRDPSQPNLRQVHLIHSELFADLRALGHDVAAGQLGENITTDGIDLLGLPVGTRLRVGTAVLGITGLRNPCEQINGFQDGLMRHLIHKRDDGVVVRLAGVMATVVRGGRIRPGDGIAVQLPPQPRFALTTV